MKSLPILCGQMQGKNVDKFSDQNVPCFKAELQEIRTKPNIDSSSLTSVKNTTPNVSYTNENQAEPVSPPLPRYYCLVEFVSGGSMKADYVEIQENQIYIGLKGGYQMTMAKSDIKSVKKHRL